MKHHSIAKIQHYVPQFLLKNFGSGKKNHLYVFDKKTDAVFVTSARGVAAERRFYDFQFKGHTLTLEPSLSALESAAKPLFKKLLQTDSLGSLTLEERATLSTFFAVQFTRTRAFREHWVSMQRLFKTKLQELADEGLEISALNDLVDETDENQTTMEQTNFISEAPSRFGPHFLNKDWVLMKTDAKRPYIIGDHPLGLQNSIDMGLQGNLGLAVRGIEIYFPLSPLRALAMWCPSHLKSLKDDFERAHPVVLKTPLQPAVSERWSWATRMLDAARNGRPIEVAPGHVINFNSLQIRHAERYVLSGIDDFDLARQMMRSPELRTGPRPRIA